MHFKWEIKATRDDLLATTLLLAGLVEPVKELGGKV
jgi:hypothetical protein